MNCKDKGAGSSCGVIIIYLDPDFNLFSDVKVSAICFKTGKAILRGNIEWVKDELAKMKVPIIGEMNLKK